MLCEIINVRCIVKKLQLDNTKTKTQQNKNRNDYPIAVLNGQVISKGNVLSLICILQW